MEGKYRRQSRDNQKSGGGDDPVDAKESSGSHSRSEHKLKRKASQEGGSGETSSASKKRHAYDSGRGTESDEMTDSQIPTSQQAAVETQA